MPLASAGFARNGQPRCRKVIHSSLGQQSLTYVKVGSIEDANNTSQAKGSREERNSIWNNIRMEIFYDASVNSLSDEKQTLLKELLETARDYFEDTLKVEREPSMEMPP
ncbi:hypothetical protein KIN20_020304 [Parelaphostrongylus tenuis]|uniref:Uncharacterized protein n=1 Tax=Parelaphostrongylus tenuis TaxID=148309 RepID=A0AAD5QVH2_PARTN|nr:hypothetical protein KIN20_020304 [Parelaphostrongylus tenuis]